MIQVKNITFSYDSRQEVFRDFSLELEKGGIYGLLGKNGTGKSTLLYLLTGLLNPGRGSVCVDGMRPFDRRPELLSEMFIVPEEFELPAVSLRAYVDVIRPFYPRFSMDLLRRCLEGFDMGMDLNLGRLSMGQKKKAYVCIALATNTRFLLMDEPTNGLDIESKSQFRKVIITGMTDEKTVILSTHQVHDVEHLLDHVVIIDHNRVLLSAPLREEEEPIDLEQLFIQTLRNAASYE